MPDGGDEVASVDTDLDARQVEEFARQFGKHADAIRDAFASVSMSGRAFITSMTSAIEAMGGKRDCVKRHPHTGLHRDTSTVWGPMESWRFPGPGGAW